MDDKWFVVDKNTARNLPVPVRNHPHWARVLLFDSENRNFHLSAPKTISEQVRCPQRSAPDLQMLHKNTGQENLDFSTFFFNLSSSSELFLKAGFTLYLPIQ